MRCSFTFSSAPPSSPRAHAHLPRHQDWKCCVACGTERSRIRATACPCSSERGRGRAAPTAAPCCREIKDTLRQKDDSKLLKAIPRALRGIKEAEASLTTSNQLKGVNGIGNALAGIIENNLWSAYPPHATVPQPAARPRMASPGEVRQ